MLNNRLKEGRTFRETLEKFREFQAKQTLLDGDREMEKKGWIRSKIFFKELTAWGKPERGKKEELKFFSELLTCVINNELKF